MSRLILVLAALLLVTVPVVAGNTIVLAHGDNLDFYGYDTPTNVSEPVRVWIFAGRANLYGIEFMTNVDQFHIVIPDAVLNSLPEGSYAMYVQFPGQNHQFDIYYEKNHLRTIYKAIQDIDISSVTPDMVQKDFDHFSGIPTVDDVVQKYTLDIQHPEVRLRNMYTTSKGKLHMDFTTNLATGDEIRAIIDEEKYQVPVYAEMMSYRTIVSGVENRTFSVEFNRDVADQLTTGTHIISIKFLSDGVTTIPFHRYERYVEPTPTPVIEHYYDFSGEMIGFDVNTTAPVESNITIVPTVTKTHETKLIETRLNNRTIGQRDIVYVGEKNLDVWGALGWEDEEVGYNFQVRWCDGDGEIVTIKDPHHYDISEDIYRSRHGGWCQYNSNLEEKNPSVAFFVRSNPGLNWTDGNETIRLQKQNETVVQVVNLSGILSNLTIYGNETEPTQTYPWEDNATVTTVETTAEPTTVPTTEVINVPLPWWITLLAIAVVVVWRE